MRNVRNATEDTTCMNEGTGSPLLPASLRTSMLQKLLAVALFLCLALPLPAFAATQAGQTTSVRPNKPQASLPNRGAARNVTPQKAPASKASPQKAGDRKASAPRPSAPKPSSKDAKAPRKDTRKAPAKDAGKDARQEPARPGRKDAGAKPAARPTPRATSPAPRARSYAGIPEVPAAKAQSTFTSCQSRFTSLKAHPTRSRQRQPWENLRNSYLGVYQAATPLAAKALDRAGDCQRELALSSHLPEEHRAAVALYEAVANEYPKAPEAASALLKAATISEKNLGNRLQAMRFVEKALRLSPTAMVRKQAEGMRASLAKGARLDAKEETMPAARPELEVLSWDNVGRDRVDVTLEFTAKARVEAKLVRPKKGPAHIEVSLFGIEVANEIRRGIAVKGSLLKTVAVRNHAGGKTTIVLGFREVGGLSTKTDRNGRRVILSCTVRPHPATQNGRDVAGLADETAVIPAAGGSDIVSSYAGSVSTVTIDAGHGGKDPGTGHNGIVERAITLDVAKRLGQILSKNGIRVIYTRKTDKFIPLPSRTAIANENRANLFVSIHVNAHASEQTRGFEIYYNDWARRNNAMAVASRENGTQVRCAALRRTAVSARSLESQKLAILLNRKALAHVRRDGYGIVGNGVKPGPFFVLSTAAMPAVLCEIGYCTNPSEARMLSDPAYRESIAAGLAEGILSYRDHRIAGMTASSEKVSREKTSGRKPSAR